MNSDKALWKASGVFAPDYPRQSSSAYTIQDSRESRSELNEALSAASASEMPGYYSVYSFPRGHSRNDNIPKVDCIFIDLDVTGSDYDPKNGDTDFDAWRRDMSELLARSRLIADAIIDGGQEAYFRATLSGHKGIHLYLDFPTIAPSNGSFEQFKNGLKAYGESVMAWLDKMAGGINIEPWVDVDASDLGRLGRHPNTVHHGSAYDDETRWCVPVTIEELSNIDVPMYLELTENPRWPSGYSRTPSESAGKRVVQEIREASASDKGTRNTSDYNPSNVQKYQNREQPNEKSRYEKSDQFTENDKIGVDDVDFLTSNYPCIKAFIERDDAYSHGNDSHIMEVNVIGKLAEIGVPRDVMHELFSNIPGYSKRETDDQIDTVLGREYKSFNCATIADRCPQFCLGDGCAVYQKHDDIQK